MNRLTLAMPPARVPAIARQRIRPAILAALTALASSALHAQPFPARAVSIVVPQSPGGPTDVEARLFAARMADLLGQPFLVDNRTGAGTSVGTVYAGKAKPDGYTLLAVGGGFTTFEALNPDAPYQTTRDFAPISLVSQRANVLVVPAAFAVKNLGEYVAHARSKPGAINFATSGSGGGIHLAGAWLHHASGTQATFVHYKGTGALLQDLIANRVQATSAGLVVSLPYLRSGKLRAIALMNSVRAPQLPDLPTVAEQGIPGFNYAAWLGFAAPAATPAPVIERLAEGFIRATRLPDLVARLEPEGSMMVGSTPAQFRQFMAAEVAQWRRVVEENSIKVEP